MIGVIGGYGGEVMGLWGIGSYEGAIGGWGEGHWGYNAIGRSRELEELGGAIGVEGGYRGWGGL